MIKRLFKSCWVNTLYELASIRLPRVCFHPPTSSPSSFETFKTNIILCARDNIFQDPSPRILRLKKKKDSKGKFLIKNWTAVSRARTIINRKKGESRSRWLPFSLKKRDVETLHALHSHLVCRSSTVMFRWHVSPEVIYLKASECIELVKFECLHGMEK